MHYKEVEVVLKELQTRESGLTTSEAEQLLHTYGQNELKAERYISPLTIFLQQFTSPLVWILILALVISVFLGETVDSIIIAVIVILNAVLGFVQEYRAEKAIEALQKMASPKALVLRNGKETKIDSVYIVPGDIILLQTGDKVPADARMIEVHDLQTQEGPLTGESQPVAKSVAVLAEKTLLADRKNMVYASTVISNGRGKAVVTHTAMNTEVGKIATMIVEAHEHLTPLQKKLRTLGKYITIAVVIVAIVVFIAGILTGQEKTSMFLAAIALAVAAIPEGLPAVITISLAVGVQRMVKRNALVRRLPSVETLGSVNVICTDKTGTLTHNEMTVTKVWANNQAYDITGSGYQPQGEFQLQQKKISEQEQEQLQVLLAIGLLCNDAKLSKESVLEKGRLKEVNVNPREKWEVFGDPTEAALLVSAGKGGCTLREVMNLHQLHGEGRDDEISFTSERKMMTVLYNSTLSNSTLSARQVPSGTSSSASSPSFISYTKGALDVLIEKCTRILLNGKVQRLTGELKKAILQQNTEFAQQALRVLGFAYNVNVTKKNAEMDMIFVGLQAMIDPPRDEVKAAIRTCQEAGIRVIMITGDHAVTAEAIARELGISGRVVSGQQFSEVSLHDMIHEIGIFARVNPEHKLRIVEALKHKGYVVAMTGDGVNDAPALKKADIGVSMGITGTEVAKEASDMILLDDNFTSIVNAVEEGRGIFDNIRKFVNYLLSSNLAEVLVIFLAMIILVPFFGTGVPLTAIQILWINLVTDGFPAVALGVDPHDKDIMKRPSRKARESIISENLARNIIFMGSIMAILILILFWLYRGSALEKAQTVAFTTLVIFEIVRLYLIRQDYHLSLFSNKYLIGAVLLSLLLQFIVLYTPLNTFFGVVPLESIDWVWIIAFSFVLVFCTIIFNYLVKLFHSAKPERRKSA